MRVLVFHGYLLRGTGSNVYNAYLAAALLRLGHEVHLVCQERHGDELEFVGAVGDWASGELLTRQVRDENCTVYRPDIGGLLPVYVRDRYEGVEARPFPELSEAELDRYLDANVAAVAEVVERVRPEAALANHLVMGPVILARALEGADVPYAVKIHGSALEYTVKPHPRFLPYAREGLAAARTILVGSRHVAESLWTALDDPSLSQRTRLGPPGVDIERFQPRDRADALGGLSAMAARDAPAAAAAGPEPESTFSRDHAGTATALAELAERAQTGSVVAFLGKLIVAKGIDLLLTTWPLVLAEVPAAQLAIIGFGSYRAAVERWIEALSAGDLQSVRELAEQGPEAEGGPRAPLHFVLSFLERLEASAERERYLAAARRMREHVLLTGRLEHDELVDVLPACDAIVVPSTFPESFGMVAVEAAACGALPISAAHSGLAEVSRALAEGLPEEVRHLTSFPLGPEAVEAIAARVIQWLKTDSDVREATRAALVEITAARYSWEGVARAVIAAAQGELDALALAA